MKDHAATSNTNSAEPGSIGAPAPVRRQRLSVFTGIILLILTGSWLAGKFRAEADIQPFLPIVFPDAVAFQPLVGHTFTAWADDERTLLEGYIAVEEAHGEELRGRPGVRP